MSTHSLTKSQLILKYIFGVSNSPNKQTWKLKFLRWPEQFIQTVKGQDNFWFFTETESGELKLPTDELLEQPSKLNKSKKYSLLRKSEETLIVNVKGQIISECPLEIFDFPKIPRKIWQISALASKKVVKL